MTAFLRLALSLFTQTAEPLRFQELAQAEAENKKLRREIEALKQQAKKGNVQP